MNGGQEVPRGLIVPRRQGPELLKLTEEILNSMAYLVQLPIISARLLAVRFGRNDSGFADLRQLVQHPLVGVVTLIGNHDRRCNRRQQFIGSVQIAGLSGRQQKASRVA
jgi:hypothetical protein